MYSLCLAEPSDQEMVRPEKLKLHVKMGGHYVDISQPISALHGNNENPTEVLGQKKMGGGGLFSGSWGNFN